ncbi:pseudouridine synthase Rsu [Caldalkalibacillus thermarum TA2.A1]|uniref:Pseudouridine synthase n=1 Tax=Caldalkalibacillus thermarum (strain TA2.A1) TaxID=986075 RepID=F5L4Y2_CALTT|nr:pseudouridine synthase [Caldalkalibacillus thermarum]EGL83595.1 pseudouridine synthase Rsu [Caldalkalibacillus thermarum TA2.A1]QZT32524.1 rRNA pseudouridine synthase [Caldalkalibacillus thermarum TA2.A1]
MRLDKLLSNMGYGSRKEVKKWLKAGVVTVNGHVVQDDKTQVDPETDHVQFQGVTVEYRPYIYLMLHKPQGVISATDDAREMTVLDLIDPEHLTYNLFPVGRLDKDAEGLLLLTNDGKLSHALLSPKRHVPKVYYAEIEGLVTEADVEAFQAGVILDDGYRTLPADLKVIHSGEHSRVELTIVEGKFHQVKRMFKAVGKRVTYLKRIKMGGLALDEGLEPGEYRELTEEEVQLLQG